MTSCCLHLLHHHAAPGRRRARLQCRISVTSSSSHTHLDVCLVAVVCARPLNHAAGGRGRCVCVRARARARRRHPPPAVFPAQGAIVGRWTKVQVVSLSNPHHTIHHHHPPAAAHRVPSPGTHTHTNQPPTSSSPSDDMSSPIHMKCVCAVCGSFARSSSSTRTHARQPRPASAHTQISFSLPSVYVTTHTHRPPLAPHPLSVAIIR